MNAGGKVRSRHAYRGKHRGRGGRFASKLGMEKGESRQLVDAFQEMEEEDGKFIVVPPWYHMKTFKKQYAPRDKKPVLPELE